ncbi:hypothetical protein CLCR_07812 [Cladophialophora carrionii]|uniref:Uncharacterized protein n=1 Tax=Cladophialophora carrionii TaxID=86049 RepID=A0A1C1CQL1_9EURO|nr:hypothetical protein CLCR_07812 [Cladophialophora carrionii]
MDPSTPANAQTLGPGPKYDGKLRWCGWAPGKDRGANREFPVLLLATESASTPKDAHFHLGCRVDSDGWDHLDEKFGAALVERRLVLSC